MRNSLLITKQDSLAFFIEIVQSFNNTHLSDESVVYVAHVLQKMMRNSSLYTTGESGKILDKPFCIQIFEAEVEPSPYLRGQIFQNIGDVVLFYSGFFRQKAKRGGLKPEYYYSLGAQCYERAATLQSNKSSIFRNVANSFENISDGIFKIQNTIVP
jgi:hypothetical protein